MRDRAPERERGPARKPIIGDLPRRNPDKIARIGAVAPVAVVVLTCAVLGLRFLVYSAALAPALKPLSARWQRAVAFLLTDQALAARIG